MIILRQKEFNSKAAKALNNKFLRQYAIDHEISRGILEGGKEPLNPQTIKKWSRMRNKFNEDNHLLVNKHINDKSEWGINASSVSSRGSRKVNKNHPLSKEYDHGTPLSSITPGHPKSIVANNPWTGEIDRTRRELIRLRTAAKKKG